MLACGHADDRHDEPLCEHLRATPPPQLEYVRWYTGAGVEAELLCPACADARANGAVVVTAHVCRPCLYRFLNESDGLAEVRGKPGIRTRELPFDATLVTTRVPAGIGKAIDLAPVDGARASVWVLLTEDGRLIRLDADSLAWSPVADAGPPTAITDDPDGWHNLRRRLHVSRSGDFAAVVDDFGLQGAVFDLRSGTRTLALQGGDYLPNTVAFSFAFVENRGRTLALHRTDWNRLDISDPATGTLLSDRGPTRYREGEPQPPHYLDYFHGALHVSPKGMHVVSDGWVWHPVGSPAAWNLDRWINDNPWESEDGPTKRDLGDRDSYWNVPIAWIDEQRVAVGGIGDNVVSLVDGARVFDVTARGRHREAHEVISFVGPAGAFFSDGTHLFSADPSGLSRWSLDDGARTGHLPGFSPTRHHRGAGELVQLADGALVRWRIR